MASTVDYAAIHDRNRLLSSLSEIIAECRRSRDSHYGPVLTDCITRIDNLARSAFERAAKGEDNGHDS